MPLAVIPTPYILVDDTADLLPLDNEQWSFSFKFKLNIPAEALAVMFNDVAYGPFIAFHDILFYLYKSSITGTVCYMYHIGYERSSFSVSQKKTDSDIFTFTPIDNNVLNTITVARTSDTAITITINGSPGAITITSSDALKPSVPRGRSICIGTPGTDVIPTAVMFPTNPTNMPTITFDDVTLTINRSAGVGSVAYRFRVDEFKDQTSAKTPITVQDPLKSTVVLLMRFDDDLKDELCHTFAADGGISYITDWVGNRAVKLNGSTSGNGGSNVIYSVNPSLDWALQGDFCIEVVGRINSNISRPRVFIRLAQGVTDIAQIFADVSGEIRIGSSMIIGTGLYSNMDGPTYVYGTPYHMCLQRIGNEIKFYVNGVQSGVTTVSSYYPPNVATAVYIGNNSRSFIDAMDGDIAWARISNGVRYTGNFIPPVEPTDTYPPCVIV